MYNSSLAANKLPCLTALETVFKYLSNCARTVYYPSRRACASPHHALPESVARWREPGRAGGCIARHQLCKKERGWLHPIVASMGGIWL